MKRALSFILAVVMVALLIPVTASATTGSDLVATLGYGIGVDGVKDAVYTGAGLPIGDPETDPVYGTAYFARDGAYFYVFVDVHDETESALLADKTGKIGGTSHSFDNLNYNDGVAVAYNMGTANESNAYAGQLGANDDGVALASLICAERSTRFNYTFNLGRHLFAPSSSVGTSVNAYGLKIGRTSTDTGYCIELKIPFGKDANGNPIDPEVNVTRPISVCVQISDSTIPDDAEVGSTATGVTRYNSGYSGSIVAWGGAGGTIYANGTNGYSLVYLEEFQNHYQTVTALKTPTALTIDSKKDSIYSLSGTHLTVAGGTDGSNANETVSANAYFAYDEHYIYVYAEVHDTSKFANSNLATGNITPLAKNDAFILGLSVDPAQGGMENGVYTSNQANIIGSGNDASGLFGVMRDTRTPATGVVSTQSRSGGYAWGTVRTAGDTYAVSTAETDDGYVVEYRIPWMQSKSADQDFYTMATTNGIDILGNVVNALAAEGATNEVFNSNDIEDPKNFRGLYYAHNNANAYTYDYLTFSDEALPELASIEVDASGVTTTGLAGGTAPDFTGLVVNGTYDNGAVAEQGVYALSIDGMTVDADYKLPMVPGTHTVTVTVGTFTDTFEITTANRFTTSTALRTPVAPTMDGNKDSIYVGTPTHYEGVGASGTAISADVSFAYDDGFLYVYADVSDPTVEISPAANYGNITPAGITDAFWIALNVDSSYGAPFGTVYGDKSTGKAANNDSVGMYAALRGGVNNSAARQGGFAWDTTGYTTYSVSNATGYSAEMRIPFNKDIDGNDFASLVEGGLISYAVFMYNNTTPNAADGIGRDGAAESIVPKTYYNSSFGGNVYSANNTASLFSYDQLVFGATPTLTGISVNADAVNTTVYSETHPDFSGLVVNAEYSNGVAVALPAAQYTITVDGVAYDSNYKTPAVPSTYSVVVTSGDYNDTFDLTVTNRFQTAVAGSTPVAPTLDGVKDVVYSTAPLHFAGTDSNNSQPISADVYFAYDDSHMYVFADVTDASESISPAANNGNITPGYRADAFWLGINVDGISGLGLNEYSNAFLTNGKYNMNQDGTGVFGVMRGGHNNRNTINGQYPFSNQTGWNSYSVSTATGYTAEMVIPFNTDYLDQPFEQLVEGGRISVALLLTNTTKPATSADGNLAEDGTNAAADYIYAGSYYPAGAIGSAYTANNNNGYSWERVIFGEANTITSISADTSALPTKFLPGSAPSFGSLVVSVNCSNGLTLPVSDYTVSIDGVTVDGTYLLPATLGTYTATVTAYGKSDTFDITVANYYQNATAPKGTVTVDATKDGIYTGDPLTISGTDSNNDAPIGAEVYFAYDDAYLYVYADVTDSSTMYTTDRYDSITPTTSNDTFLLGLLLNKNQVGSENGIYAPGNAGNNGTDGAGLAAGMRAAVANATTDINNLKSQRSGAYTGSPNVLVEGSAYNISRVKNADGSGYKVEMAIPWTTGYNGTKNYYETAKADGIAVLATVYNMTSNYANKAGSSEPFFSNSHVPAGYSCRTRAYWYNNTGDSWDCVELLAENKTVTYTNGETTISTASCEKDSAVVLPAGPAVDSADLFIGWMINDVLYPAGASYTVSENTVADACVIRFETLAGARIRLGHKFTNNVFDLDASAAVSGIRFDTSFLSSQLTALNGKVGAIETGTLIFPQDLLRNSDTRLTAGAIYYEQNGVFTCDTATAQEGAPETDSALTTATTVTKGDKQYDVTKIININNAAVAQHVVNGETYDYFKGSLVSLKTSNFNRNFVGTSYITITYNGGSSVTYYSGTQVARSIHYVANAAIASGTAYADNDVLLLNRYAGINQ